LAGRAIPTEDLVRLGDALPPDSSGLVVMAGDTAAERVIDGMKGYHANVVTGVAGDELSGEIDAAVLAQLSRPPREVPTPDAAPPTPAPLDAPSAPAAPASNPPSAGTRP
jgi:hypothetical protein